MTFDEHANASDGNNVSAFQGATSSEVAAIAARFKAWALRAASLREDQLLQRQADAFARGSLHEAATPTPKPSAKKRASRQAPSLRASLRSLQLSLHNSRSSRSTSSQS